MCRFAVYVSPSKPVLLADLLTRPNHSIVKQSYGCTERKVSYAVPSSLNADGFGIAWYPLQNKQVTDNTEAKESEEAQEGACLFCSILPAWNDKNLHRISEKIESPIVFAHVRAASLGSIISQTNCHPFVHNQYTFMHNGGIGGFSELKKHIITTISADLYKHINGTTDSEHAFMLFLNHLPSQKNRGNALQEPQALLMALKKTVVHILHLQRKLKLNVESLLNFAVSDGNTTLVSRIYLHSKTDVDENEISIESKAASLYFSCGSMWTLCSDNEYRMRHTNMNEDAVIVASERLSLNHEDWVEVPHNRIVVISNKTNVLMFPINIEKELQRFEKDLKANKVANQSK
mmetsp:Transcript_11342/g.17217  ORF Transcript_11342/g.17217 Transcript_11342/m.17217 type:complete len:347 (-) Transcript_11342:76-1116(-)